jgi:hypothetical protein
MIRRNARLRKEYLYRKSLEGKEKATYERKRQIRKALDGERLFWCAACSTLVDWLLTQQQSSSSSSSSSHKPYHCLTAQILSAHFPAVSSCKFVV